MIAGLPSSQELAIVETKLAKMVIGVNCTHEQYLDVVCERNALILREEIDNQIVEEIIACMQKDKQ